MIKNTIKDFVQSIVLNLKAGEMKPSPAIGSALGSRKVNIGAFLKNVNEIVKQNNIEQGQKIKVTVFFDKSMGFTLKVSRPLLSELIKKEANIEKGSSFTKQQPFIAKITAEQCKKIAVAKLPDLNAFDLNAAMSMVKSSALSMGVEVLTD